MRWREHAACINAETSVFFPADAREPDAWNIARTYCAECPVVTHCLDSVMSIEVTDDRWGMFGGHTPHERKLLRRKRISR
ncbi:WhiB-like iron-sulfur binding domain containing protein [uncultured Caudovirales phage]|uniref:WhiB-like iron-sulfur binding domain containing protein n=1 Tax=uncultured Caudovirales phage TaxID=2100421 RepID=A0A6J5S6J9_9CAUD|nr:WhiB-like iron-sulfur binding domain containing protein [uncultured Caudovirales phage]